MAGQLTDVRTDADADAVPTAARLQAFLDGRWADAREASRRLLAEPLLHPVAGLERGAHRERVLAQARRLAEAGAPRALYPRAVGGTEDVGAAVTGFEALGMGDVSLWVKAGVQWGLFGGSILHLGTARHHERLLPAVMSLDLPGCFAMTETGHGSDVQSIRTTATYDAEAGEFVVTTPDEDARKDYIGNAACHGRMATVFAQLVVDGVAHGVHALLVPIRDADGEPLPGVTIADCGPKAGLNGVDNGRLTFSDVRVPREALLDRYGAVDEQGRYSSPIEDRTKRFFTMLGTLVQGRVSVAGAALSATKVALAIAVRYGEVRRQFRPPGDDADEVRILDYRAHQRVLLPALARVGLGGGEVVVVPRDDFTAAEPDAGERRRLESAAAGLKAITTWHATATIQACREACGGAGYLSENRLPDLRADTDVFTTFEGDNTVLLQLVGKGLLTDYRDEFGTLDTLGMVRFVADQVVGTVVERTAARSLVQSLMDRVPGREEATDVRDRGYHLALLTWREEHVVEGLARRMRAATEAGEPPFAVLNAVQDHLLLAARAHVERVVLEHVVAAIDRCEDPEVAALLERVCDLHALAAIEAERGWFLEHGRITGARAKAITAAVNDLCGELRPHARLLVDAFGVPEEALAAPIARGDEARRQDLRDRAG
jgi:acyl-CoA oxidase